MAQSSVDMRRTEKLGVIVSVMKRLNVCICCLDNAVLKYAKQCSDRFAFSFCLVENTGHAVVRMP